MNNICGYTQWEIQKFDFLAEQWKVLDVFYTEDEAMKKAPFYAHQHGEVRIVKHEEYTTIIGTMKKKEKHD